jgi:hypothetical protein
LTIAAIEDFDELKHLEKIAKWQVYFKLQCLISPAEWHIDDRRGGGMPTFFSMSDRMKETRRISTKHSRTYP